MITLAICTTVILMLAIILFITSLYSDDSSGPLIMAVSAAFALIGTITGTVAYDMPRASVVVVTSPLLMRVPCVEAPNSH